MGAVHRDSDPCVTHILQKLNLRDRVQAVVLAHETRLFADDAKPIHPLGEPPARSAPG